MIRFFIDAGYIVSGLLGSAASILPLEKYETKYHFLGKALFHLQIDPPTQTLLETLHGKQTVEIALKSPKKSLVRSYLFNLIRKSSAIGSTLLMGVLLPNVSIIRLLPKHEMISELFTKKTSLFAVRALSHTFIWAKKYRIFLLSPIIIQWISILCETAELKLKTLKNNQRDNKWMEISIQTLSKGSKFFHEMGQMAEAIFWTRIALLILIGNKSQETTLIEKLVSFIKAFIPLDQLFKNISSHQEDVRAILVRAFALLGSIHSSLTIFSHTSIQTNLKTLNELCMKVDSLEFGNTLDSFFPNELAAIVSSIDDAFQKKQVEESDRRVLLNQIAKKILNKFHTMHPLLIRLNVEEIETMQKKFENEPVKQVFDTGLPQAWANLFFTFALYKIAKEIHQYLEIAKTAKEEQELSKISKNPYVQKAKDHIHIITDLLPQFEAYCLEKKIDFETLPQSEKQKLRLKYLRCDEHKNHPEKNPYQTLFIEIYQDRKNRGTGNYQFSQNPFYLNALAKAYIDLAKLCFIVRGYDRVLIKYLKMISKDHGLANSFWNKVQDFHKLAEELKKRN